MKLLLILVSSLIPFISFLQKTGTLVLSGDADYYGYDKSEFTVYFNETELGKFDKDGSFDLPEGQKVPLTIVHPDFITHTIDKLTFSRKSTRQSVFEQISPEAEKMLFNQFESQQLSTCTGSVKKEIDVFAIDSSASFPGGNQAMFKFISEHTVYPQAAIIRGIEGKVYAQFIVEADGSITCVKIMKGIDYLLDREAFRCIMSFPKFKPAIRDGAAVPIVISLPITFNLN
jgi:TonB family protein